MPRSGAENPFPIVGVGASAGGLDALRRLIHALPRQPGLALVIVQHLDPTHQSRLSEILSTDSPVEVVDAVHGIHVEVDHAYVIQPNTSVAIADGVLSVTVRPEPRHAHYPIDHFFRSLAAVQGPLSVGVVLSGTGSDGTLGVCEIKAAGGVTFAQDEASAQHAGMIQSAIASGSIDAVLPPEEIAERLADLPRHPYLRTAEKAELPEASDAEQFQQVIAALQSSTGVDFSQYRDTTIKRRTARRMLLRGVRSPSDYAALLNRDEAEARALYRDVLINVTSFFRDPEMFETLKSTVLPDIISSKSETQPIRIWVPGCSTGEEAYSIAMVLLEVLDERNLKRDIQVFATDLGDPASLERGRNGLYPESIEADVSTMRLRRFFVREHHSYRIQKRVRELCVFARQNVIVDPPFSRVDLISCRNVLIYMSPPLQERLLPVFHFALNPRGFLVLGAAETIGRFVDLFDPVSRADKVFRRKDGVARPQLTFMPEEWLTGASERPQLQAEPLQSVLDEAGRLVLGRYAPPCVMVDRNFEVQQFRGRTGAFLEAPPGHPTTNILRMAREGLQMDLRTALAEAKASRAPVVREHLHVTDAGADLEFTLRILPVSGAHPADPCLLVIFEPRDWPSWSPSGPAPGNGLDGDAAWLRQELASSRDYLQSVLAAHDTANQSLRAAHEEVLSSNEELQSTNEELETTKEELQSSNEELTTVNEQFQQRNRELDILTDDLSNFIASADVPMVTVDRELHIRRLTAAAARAFNVLPSDAGRSIQHIRFALDVEPLAMRQVIESVIASGQSWERDLVDHDGRWWVLRVRPFITSENRIEGATLVAIDIDSVKRSSELIEARDYALAVVRTVREPLVVLDIECRVGLANEAYYRLVREGPQETDGRLLWETARGLWAAPPLRRALRAACASEAPIVDLEIERMLPDRGLRTLVLNAQTIVRAARPGLLLLSVEDVTDLRQAEALRIDAETLRLMDRRKDEFLGILAHELRNPLAPMRFAIELMRRSRDEDELTRSRQVLERQVGHMVRIVDDLLDVSRITQGKVELRKELLSLPEVIQSAIELCRPSIDAAHHALTVSLPDEPLIVTGDTVRLTQVFVNLLNNAIKFTPHGGHLWLIVEKTGELGEEPDQVRVRVRDTGIGIPPEIRLRIFEMFMQGDRSLERTRGGLGVGLTLVRNLVALHGGSIEARSEGEGQGSEFIVTLPLELSAQAQAQAQAQAAPLPSRTLRILVADDNQDGREMLEFLLTKEGHTVVSAEDGLRAVELAGTFPCDVAVLDIGMPGLNGYEVAERLREQGRCPLLVALSGLGQAEDKTRAAAAGFDRHFTKPIDIGALMGVIAERLAPVIPSGNGSTEQTYDEQDNAGGGHGADPDRRHQ